MDHLKKILVISLYNGDNEIEEADSEEFAEITSNATRCTKGDRVIWMDEEFMYMEL